MQWSEIRLVWLNYLYFGTHRLQLQTESPFKLSLVDLHISQRISALEGRKLSCFLSGNILIFFQFWFPVLLSSHCKPRNLGSQAPSQSQLLSDTASSLTQRETLYSVGISSNRLLRGPLGSAVPSQRQACNRQ